MNKPKRIAIIGPTGAGKSTLAVKLAKQYNLPVVHFDQLRHVPNTDWQSKPEAEINRLHDEAIAQHKWVFDGNGGSLMPSRFNRADMVIWCDPNLFGCAFRFIRRPFLKKKRHGGLVGATVNIQWDVIKFIFTTYRNKNRKRYLKTIKQAQQQNPNLKFIHLTSFKEIKSFKSNDTEE